MIVLVSLPESPCYDLVLRGLWEQALIKRWTLMRVRPEPHLSLEQICDPLLLPELCVVVTHPLLYPCWPAALFSSRLTILVADADPPAGVSSVGFVDEAIGEMAAEHLLNLGCRAFSAYCQCSDSELRHGEHLHRFGERRVTGFFRRIASSGMQVHEPEKRFGLAARGEEHLSIASVGRWLSRAPKPLGVFATCDGWAPIVLLAARHAGLRVPEDVRIIGAGNDELTCEMAVPRLSSVSMPWRKLGTEAASLIDRYLGAGDGQGDPLHIELPPVEVVARASTGLSCPADPLIADAIRYIEQNCHRPIGVPDILGHVPMYRRELERGFRKHLNHSVTEVIRYYRFEHAKRLLRSTDLSAERVAEECGLSSPSKLTHLCIRMAGMTATAYREQSRRGQ